jgi:hypothetical protein
MEAERLMPPLPVIGLGFMFVRLSGGWLGWLAPASNAPRSRCAMPWSWRWERMFSTTPASGMIALRTSWGAVLTFTLVMSASRAVSTVRDRRMRLGGSSGITLVSSREGKSKRLRLVMPGVGVAPWMAGVGFGVDALPD